MDLEQLKSKAAAANRRRESEETLKAPGKKKSRFSRGRWIVWFLEAVAVAAAVEYFIWQPWRERVRVRKTARAEQVPGDPAPVLAREAMRLTGLSEVNDALLASTGGLAPGAVTARAAQVQVCRDNKLPVEVENSIGMRFRLIPNGSFVAGSPEGEPGRSADETPYVGEIPAPFYLGKWEVTQAQWETVMGNDANPSGFAGRRRPVEEVKWYDCQRFVIALAEREGLPKWTYRLPTELEWEYACRAGSSLAYHFGADPKRLRRFDFYDGNSYGHTQPCGLKRSNAFGLHDMHGNVWEWCRNAYSEDPRAQAADTTGVRWRAIRGGNFYLTENKCRSATRARLPPLSHGNLLGFRVMRVIPELFEVVQPDPPTASAPTPESPTPPAHREPQQ